MGYVPQIFEATTYSRLLGIFSVLSYYRSVLLIFGNATGLLSKYNYYFYQTPTRRCNTTLGAACNSADCTCVGWSFYFTIKQTNPKSLHSSRAGTEKQLSQQAQG